MSSNNPGAYDKASARLSAAAFSLESLRVLFQTFTDLRARDVRIDVTTVANELGPKLHSLGGASELAELIDVPLITNLDAYIGIVREHFARWQATVYCEEIIARFNGCEQPAQVAAEAHKHFEELTNSLCAPTEHPLRIADLPSVHALNNSGIGFALGGLFAFGAITAVTGDAGAGKTTFVTAACGHVAAGLPFLGRDVIQTEVLILDRENSLPILQERLRRLGIQDGSALRIWGGHNKEPVPSPASPTVVEYVAACNPKPVIVVDSLIAFLECDENDAAEVRAFMSQLRRLADMGAAVIVLHHSGKGESARDYRGSSDIKAAIDVGYLLTSMGDGGLDRLRLKAFKTRFQVDTDLILGYTDGQFTFDERPGAVSKTVSDQLNKLLRDLAPVQTKAFEDEAAKQNLGRDRARRFLRDGVKDGSIIQEQGPLNAKLHRPAVEEPNGLF
jgi:hypothetical protein